MGTRKIPSRVVSLVPSLTESLFDMGLGHTLIGVTDYCVHPMEKTSRLPSVGGPGDAPLEEILSLDPDFVLAGQEENDPETIHSLEKAGIRVFLVFPKTAVQAVNMLLDLAGIFESEEARLRAKTLQVTLEWQAAAAQTRKPFKVFCPIWLDHLEDGTPWWMTFNADTYASSVLSLFSGLNVFASRDRRYPLLADLGLSVSEDPIGRDMRYPRIPEAEISACGAEVVLFPSEPYPFTDSDVNQFCQSFPGLPAVRSGRLYTFDGSLLSWYGTRLALALDQLGSIFDL